ncbi:MAG: S8 family serine peptidase [Planctomycetota bacterium]
MKLTAPFFLVLASATVLVAQELPVQTPDAPNKVGLGTEPVPGVIPGTLRYNVTFKTRSFDLREFKAANDNKAGGPVVQAIVRDLEQRARADQEPFRQAVEALGGAVNIHFWLINAANIEVPPAKLDAVRALPNVLFVTPDLPTYPLGAAAPAPIKTATNSNHHNADAEQAAGNKGTNVTVAIVDTSADSSLHGVDMPHQVFYRNADRNNHTGAGLDGSRLLAAVQVGTQPPNNSHPHGTGVAGIAAGAGWSTAGADAGHASDAGIVVYSICNVAGSCGSSLATEAAGWQRVAADAATYNTVAANMSYSSSPDPTDVSQQAIDACALNANVLPVTAAGNSGSSTGGSSSTANGVAVAAIEPNTKVVADFSSRGPMSGDTQRFYPDISANGVNTVMPQWGNESVDWIADGTSMASPQVCGAAGLVKNARPGSTALELKALLLNNTESIQTQNSTLNRNAFGMGYLRDDLSCSSARANNVLTSTLASTTTPATHTLAVQRNQIYAVTLTWHRHVLTSTAWSDMSLTIKDGANVLATSDSPRNLYEKVEFTAPSTGNVTIEVAATSLEIASVPYALAFGLSSANGLAAVRKSGVGCVNGAMSYYELFDAGTIDMTGRAIHMLPNAGGYAVSASTASYTAPTSIGLALSDDSLSSAISLPFTFVFPGGSTNQIRICSNGFIYLTGSGTSTSYIPTVASALTGGPRLFPMWSDLLPDSSTNVNNVFYEADTANGLVRVTWRNVPEYGNSSQINTFQAVLYATGEVDLIYVQARIASHQALVAFSPGVNNRDPGNRDITATLPFFTQGSDVNAVSQDATRPVLGSTCNLLVSDIAAGSLGGVEIIGVQIPGIDLSFLGMPECFLYNNPILATLPFGVSGSSATIPLPIPNDLALTGGQVPVQAATLSPGLNARGVATSNLAVLVLGPF